MSWMDSEDGPRIEISRERLESFEEGSRREWLVTNGLGGFAGCSLAGANTQRYHGHLVAAIRPPVERIVSVAKLEESVRTVGQETEPVELSCNQFEDGVRPEGFRYLDSFVLGRCPRFRYRVGEIVLEKILFLVSHRNEAVVAYRHLDGPEAELRVQPLIAQRDYHSLVRRNAWFRVDPIAEPGVLSLRPYEALPPIFIASSHGEFLLNAEWKEGIRFPIEMERGLDFEEDVFSIGTYVGRLEQGESWVFVLSCQDELPTRLRNPDRLEQWAADAWLGRQSHLRNVEEAPRHNRNRAGRVLAERARDYRSPSGIPVGDGGGEALPEEKLAILARAADQFWVQRGESGSSVIAGYHWFTDWGRDAMISLPGLMLATGGFYQGRQVLETFCRHIDQGMIPNRFPDEGEAPEYNTGDATLWMFWAADYYLRCTGDEAFLRNTLYPAFSEIIEHHNRGTRYRIHVDDGDGLLFAGEQGVQLTWMDAKAGDWVVTPRIGKPIEINALWHFALSAQAVFAEHLNLPSDAARYRRMAERVRDAFDRTFWNRELGYYNDLVGESGPDASLRPNQVLALSLPTDLAPVEHARLALSAVTESLLTPYGLRSLAPDDSQYIGVYTGDRVSRDGAYHQGTVWSWLSAPYVSAHRKVHGRNLQSLSHARRVIRPLLDHLEDACVGSLSEIFDGDPPHAPKGCVAQAWSVAEVVRVWLEEGL